MPYIENRRFIIEQLRQELIGPCPSGDPLPISIENGIARFPDDEARKKNYVFVDPDGTRREILKSSPTSRYGVGILFPQKVTENSLAQAEDAETEGIETEPDGTSETVESADETDAVSFQQEDGAYDDSVSLANAYKPSSMGVSFISELPDGNLSVKVEAVIYRLFKAEVAGTVKKADEKKEAEKNAEHLVDTETKQLEQTASSPSNELEPAADTETEQPANGESKRQEKKHGVYDWWAESPILADILIPCERLRRDKSEPCPVPNHPKLTLEIYTRKVKDVNGYIVTVMLINKFTSEDDGRKDEKCFFRCGFSVSHDSGEKFILPYVGVRNAEPDDEERSIALLYRRRKTFAVGHGVAASWSQLSGAETATSVRTETMPEFEAPSVTPNLPNLFDADGSPLRFSMRELAEGTEAGFRKLSLLADAYESWIVEREAEAASLSDSNSYRNKQTAEAHLALCRQALNRIRNGIEYLTAHPDAHRAFRLANEAILRQQLVVGSVRPAKSVNTFDGDWTHQNLTTLPEVLPSSNKGYWRPFQVAFLLMSLCGVSEPNHPENNLVDLIWFPTGGGKTEAYLGLTAYLIFLQRLRASADRRFAVSVIMRYTLRLLTAQQFQRAAALTCAMELIRKRETLGDTPITVGIWVGSATTPNDRKKALSSLSALKRDTVAENPFVLLQCPWCNAQMGKRFKQPKEKKYTVLGYQPKDDTVKYQCADINCHFSGIKGAELPICVIDEDLYRQPPTILISTVDKFALLPWYTASGSFFGLEKGKRVAPPPALIIQDELHLISGPLGTMVGLYETLIEELCTVRDESHRVIGKPKIVASTATIRRAPEQINAVFARNKEDVRLFPPPALDADDSFFARTAKNKDGTLKPGKIYLGVFATGLPSDVTAQVRVYSALLQGAQNLPVAAASSEKDPWWTLLSFYNNIRELGTGLTLISSDVPQHLEVIKARLGPSSVRKLNSETLELTSRLTNSKIPDALKKLETSYNTTGCIDVCLASNIIEVGVDIVRLGLITVIGQPKTTAQYIQVSGRVGRRFDEPGLAVVIYDMTKPRDRSHYERFISYHASLYAQVEPTSVTPFSAPALERGLHAVFIGMIRHLIGGDYGEDPRRFTAAYNSSGSDAVALKQRVKLLKETILARANAVKALSDSPQHIRQRLEEVLAHWFNFNPEKYKTFKPREEANPTLLYPMGTVLPQVWSHQSLPTMTSLRNVDASCEGAVTPFYVIQAQNQNPV